MADLVPNINLEKVCICCLQEDEKLITFDIKKEECYSVLIMLKICSSMQLIASNVNIIVCTSCLNNLNDFYNFRQMCIQSQLIIQKYKKSFEVGTESIARESVQMEHPENKKLINDNILHVEVNKTSNEFCRALFDQQATKTRYLCSLCGCTFISNATLNRHEKVHNSINHFQCKKCPQKFRTSNDLKVHVRCHTGEKPYLCSTCGKMFARITHLNTHTRIHTGEKPYKCAFCGDAFTQSGVLRSHEMTHTGQRPFKCKECKRSFIQSSGLASHMRIHSAEKPHSCSICKKEFSLESSLKRHGMCHV